MCGIAGKVMIDPHAPVDEETVWAMARTLRHRGPDDEGVLVGPGFGLGHTRLAIIDLSERGRQPLVNEAGNLRLVFNGEIYNFQTLKKDLEARGHQFCSSTDGEVILHLYEDHGPQCLDFLRGMFAFALYDKKNRTLFAARDRLGKKPFVYALNHEALFFGSEIKAILADPSVSPAPDPEAIHYYLSYQYVPAPWTAFQGIRKLPPAHYLIFKNGQLSLKQYWRLSFAEPLSLQDQGGEGGLAEALLERLKEAVKIRLSSDVPLGAFLSGGVDSSAVVALMSACTDQPVKTFCIGFEEKEYDESARAREVSRLFHTDHTEMIVKPDALSILPKLIWHYNEPFADASGIPSFYLSELAAREVKVVLNGDGGDEGFAGYLRYRAHALAEWFSFFPGPLRKVLCRCALALLPGAAGSGVGTLWRWKRFLRHASLPPEKRNFNWFCYVDDSLKERLYTPDFIKAHSPSPAWALMADAYRASDGPDFLSRTLDVDIQTYLPHDLLAKVDIATMAFSLEGRSPFLDHKLIEFAARIPASLKLKGFKSKYILKAALKGILPERILKRPKAGFGVPIDVWLRGELKEMAYEVLTGPKAAGRGLFRIPEVRRLLDEHCAGQENRHLPLWALLMLELWFRRFIDNGGEGPLF